MSVGIYIHIPFCHRKCNYCDFLSYEHQGTVPDEYVNHLLEEWYLREGEINEKVHSIYFGGGTPSLLTGNQVRVILDAIRSKVSLSDNIEITLEMNPESYRENDVADYLEAGVNRFSIGLQSTFDDILLVVGRLHSLDRFLEVYKKLRHQGASNISVDLMFNLPGLSLDKLSKSLEAVVALRPEHISTYSLKVEEGTLLEKLVDQGQVVIGEEDDDRDQHDLTRNYLLDHGFEHYEISNFAKPGYASRHNLTYWRNEDYLALGLGAHGKINGKRYYNEDTLEKYYSRLSAHQLPNGHVDVLEEWEVDFESVMLGVRISEGVAIDTYRQHYKGFTKLTNRLVDDGLLEYVGLKVRLTERGRNLENIVSYEFYELMEG